jgi:hypothetical protein
MWRCTCDCGNEGLVASAHLRYGDSVQCKPCSIRQRHARELTARGLAGKRFQKWTILQAIPRKCLARCDCGNTAWRSTQSIVSGNSTQCWECGVAPRLNAGEAAFRQIINTYRGNARKRGHVWELTNEQARLLFEQACEYCGKLPTESPINCKKAPSGGIGDFIYNGIDRKDNAVGYTTENSVTCCVLCNRAKRELSLSDFLAWIARLRNS